MLDSKPPLVFIVGPTACGKSCLGLEVAQKVQGQIINGDSLQVYSSLNIGTAKPSLQEQGLCPHRLFGYVKDGEKYTAGEYRRDALNVLSESPSQGLPVVVGGSGFYLQALEKGMYSIPEVPSEIQSQLESRVATEGLPSLYNELVIKDGPWAETIKPQDSYRILRALGVLYSHGKTMTQIRQEFERSDNNMSHRFKVIKVGVFHDRDRLRQRVAQRLENMLHGGWEQEVDELLAKGLGDWAPMQSVGYKEMLLWKQGQLSLQERNQEIIKNTMRLAKRQMTWFKRDPSVNWFDGEKEVTKAGQHLLNALSHY